MTKTLKVTGSYKGATGHDHHTRSIVRAFHQTGMHIQLYDLPQWSPAKLPPSLQDPWFEQLQAPVKAESHLFFCMPHQVLPEPGVRTINYTMFEADRIPDLWVRHSEAHDLIVVPVNSCRQAWIDSGVPEEKVLVCPLGVDPYCFSPDVAPLGLQTSAGHPVADFRVRFLNVSDAIERKNLPGLLRAWLEVTTVDDDSVLILKPGFYARGARERFLEGLRELETSVGIPFERAAPIVFVDGLLPPQDMPALYTAATHYVSASRGEGFDQPMVEAGVSGLQLIAPRHTAYLDYLHDGIAHLISARAVRARLPDDPATEEFFAGAHWWEPDHDELCGTLRAIIDGNEEGKAAARDELARLTWSSTAQLLEQVIFRS